jgi:nitroreductase
MEFYDVVKSRRSIRGYTDQAIETEKLDRIWTVVRQAPTACNLQPFRVLAITSPKMRSAVCECYPRPWLAQAPMIVVVLANRETCWKRSNGQSIYEVDAAIVMDHLILAATAEGLGTCWVCAFDQVKLQRTLELEANWLPVALTPLGYAAAAPTEFVRKDLSDLVQTL